MTIPSVGRIVHYSEDGECRAAIVTAVDGEKVSLAVFAPDGNYHRRNADWHWPERV